MLLKFRQTRRSKLRFFFEQAKMVKSVISMEQLKALWHSEVHNEQKWAANMVKSLPFLSL